jgi:hypothetical protein
MLETSYSQALTDNTWGMAISKPNSEEDVLFRGLPSTEKEIITLKATSEATPAGDESTFYYGAYITPDLDYGTYGGVTINYVALANVDSDVVTVQYHTGYGSNERTNTVVYGAKPRVAYYYNGCSTEYLGEPQILKTDNIDDDGIMLERMMTAYDEPRSIEFEDADYLRVELTYGFSDSSRVGVYLLFEDGRYSFYGNFRSNDRWEDDHEVTTVVFDIDSNIIGLSTASSGSDGYTGSNYGYYAKITPVYANKPSNVNVVEYENCYIAKSDNVDDSGNKTRNFVSTEKYVRNSIVVPGADRIVVDVKYGFADYDIEFEISNSTVYYPTDRGSMYSYHDAILTSADSRFYLGGTSATVGFYLYDEIESQSGAFGYYMRGYPIYREERENTIPVLVYDAYRKSGTYYSPNFGDWARLSDDLRREDKFLEEINVIKFIGNNYETLKGQTLDLKELTYAE